MGEPKKLHDKWKNFKDGAGAEMIKQRNLKFSADLGPTLDTLDAKWGTSDGQKAADKLKTIVKQYTQILDNVKPLKTDDGMQDKRPAVKGPELQVKTGKEILTSINNLAASHKLAKTAH